MTIPSVPYQAVILNSQVRVQNFQAQVQVFHRLVDHELVVVEADVAAPPKEAAVVVAEDEDGAAAEGDVGAVVEVYRVGIGILRLDDHARDQARDQVRRRADVVRVMDVAHVEEFHSRQRQDEVHRQRQFLHLPSPTRLRTAPELVVAPEPVALVPSSVFAPAASAIASDGIQDPQVHSASLLPSLQEFPLDSPHLPQYQDRLRDPRARYSVTSPYAADQHRVLVVKEAMAAVDVDVAGRIVGIVNGARAVVERVVVDRPRRAVDR